MPCEISSALGWGEFVVLSNVQLLTIFDSRTVVNKPKLLNDILREDLWNAIQKIRERSLKIDASKVIAVEMVNRVTVHLEKIRISEARSYGFPLNSYRLELSFMFLQR